MAFYDTTWYCNAGDQSTTGYYAVTKWAASTAVAAGVLRRQLAAPAVNGERVFVCIVAGTTGGSEPAWTLTRGAKTTDSTATWMEVTGQASLNGDLTNTATWAQVKAVTPAVLGQIIKRSNNASYQICTTAGAMSASEPSFSDTAGVTTTDTTAVWTSLGVVGNFTGGQGPHARLANACAPTWFAAGNTVYVGDNHAESQATAITIAPALAVANIGRIVCHNHSGSYPPAASNLSTSATISTTAVVSITFNPTSGAIYVYGISFIAGAGAGNINIIMTGANAWYYFDACLFKLNSTSASACLIQAGGGSLVMWNNCTVYFGNTANYIDIGTTGFSWQNTGPILASGSVVPAGLFGQSANSRLCSIVLEAIDLSQITGAIDKQAAAFEMGTWLIKDCKLNASMTLPTPQAYGQTIQLVRSDSGATGYKSARYQYEGTETTETSITRVGGAADPTGQLQSRKIVTTANSQWLRPFRAEPYAIWNAVTGATVTVTVCGTINAGALPNNDDLWLECEYISDSSFPLGKIVTSTKANLLAANAAVASDGSSWSMQTSLDEAPSNANATTTNNGLTAVHTSSTSTGSVGSLAISSSGKSYIEVKSDQINSGGNHYVGFKSPSVVGAFSTASSPAVGLNTGSGVGNILIDGVVQTGKAIGSFVTGDIVCIAIDLTNSRIWFRKNNGIWNNDATANPATNTNGLTLTVPGYGFVVGFTNSGINDSFTVNFGASAYTYTAPSGFGAWNPNSPFKLTTTLSSPQPGMAGYIHARVRAAKPSATYYIDPMVTLS